MKSLLTRKLSCNTSNKSFLLIELLLVVFFVSLTSFFIVRGYGNFVKVAHKKLIILRSLLLTEEAACNIFLKEKEFALLKEGPGEYTFSDERFVFTFEPTENIMGNLWSYECVLYHNNKPRSKLDSIVFLTYDTENAQ